MQSHRPHGARRRTRCSPGSEFRKHWNMQRKAAFASGARQACDVELRRLDGVRIAVRMEGLVSGTKGKRRCHVALIDITAQRNAEKALSDLNRLLGHRWTNQSWLQAQAVAQTTERKRLERALR